MKRQIPYAIAAVIAASGVSLALAQKDKDVNRVDTNANPHASAAMSDANVPNTRPDVNAAGASAAGQKSNPAPALNFAQEPTATASTTQGAQGQMVESIVQALNADQALRNAKITVQPVEGKIYLSGAALTEAQKKEANRVALSQAGETQVVNIILTDDA